MPKLVLGEWSHNCQEWEETLPPLDDSCPLEDEYSKASESVCPRAHMTQSQTYHSVEQLVFLFIL